MTGFQAAYGADLIGATIRRIRGWHFFRSGNAGNSVRVSAGIGVFPAGVTTAAVAPSGNKHLDWMWYNDFFAEPVVATEFSQVNMMDRDVRSQRKMEELGDDLLLVLSNIHPTDPVTYAYSSSVLLALP